MPETILDKYLTLTGSTTRFLEQLANAPISAKVLSQSVDQTEAVILRVSTSVSYTHLTLPTIYSV